jgi:hypothetical protein
MGKLLQWEWLTSRREFWKEMHSHWSFKTVALMWSLFGVISLFLPFWPRLSKKFYGLAFLPKWPWYIWVIGLLVLIMLAVFEGGHRQVQTYKIRAKESQNALRQRVLDLGHDLFAFLREIGPRPEHVVDNRKAIEEKVAEYMRVNAPQVEKIHYGYLKKFKQRAVDLFMDLDAAHIEYELKDWEIAPPQAVRGETVKKIAEQCFLIAARMEIAEESKGT